MSRVVIIGGDAAGMSAAAVVNRQVDDGEVVVFERGDFTSYAACGLPYLVGGVVQDESDLVTRSPEEHRRNGIDVRMRNEVVRIDSEQRFVEVRSLEDQRTFTEPFDHLVIATGAQPIRPPLDNIDAGGIFGVQTIPNAVAIDEAIEQRSVKRAVVVGAGYIGIEMVEALLNRGLKVTVVEMADQPMSVLDPDMGERVAQAMRQMGVDLRLGAEVQGFKTSESGEVRSVATDGDEISTDMVVMGLGVRPSVQLAEKAGVRIGPTGAIATDARMRTSVENIWAAGDCVESLHRVSQAPVNIALGTHANKQGRVVGENISGGNARFPGVIGTAITKVGDLEIGLTGLNERAAADAGFDAVGTVIEDTTRARYYPGSSGIAVKVVVERRSGLLLGAQIVGGSGSAKRIDALAVAVWNEMTADDFAQLDLGYAPPFSPTIDPTLMAARVGAKNARKGSTDERH